MAVLCLGRAAKRPAGARYLSRDKARVGRMSVSALHQAVRSHTAQARALGLSAMNVLVPRADSGQHPERRNRRSRPRVPPIYPPAPKSGRVPPARSAGRMPETSRQRSAGALDRSESGREVSEGTTALREPLVTTFAR